MWLNEKMFCSTSKDIFESIANYFLIHRGRVFGIFENVLDLRKTSLGKVFGRKVILTSELAKLVRKELTFIKIENDDTQCQCFLKAEKIERNFHCASKTEEMNYSCIYCSYATKNENEIFIHLHLHFINSSSKALLTGYYKALICYCYCRYIATAIISNIKENPV